MILILDSDRNRGKQMQLHLWSLHLIADVATYETLRKRVPSERITDEITFLLLLRPNDPGRPPLFFKTFHKKYKYPIVMLGGDETVRDIKEINAPDLILSAKLTDRKILRETRDLMVSRGKPDPWDKIAGGVRDRIEYADHTVYGEPMMFNRSERMFLRTLILAFPTPVPIEELRVRCAPPGTKKTLNALKVLGSKINKKALATVHRKIVNWDADRFWIRTSKTDPGPTVHHDPEEDYIESYYFDEFRYFPRHAF